MIFTIRYKVKTNKNKAIPFLRLILFFENRLRINRSKAIGITILKPRVIAAIFK